MALVGRYETYEQLGIGSTGTIYRARDSVLGREVALRILNQHARVSSRLARSFAAVRQVPPGWLHPNIAVIYDLGRAKAGGFVATELLAGADMRSYIRDRRRLSLLQKLDLLAQAATGLAHAHENGIVHGAIRPGSFFIDERQQVKILDFGIRYLDLPESEIASNPALIDYCSPEQLATGSYTERSDIFSAALVFYEFLVFVHPFRDPKIPNRIANDAPDPLLGHDPTLPQSLETLLNLALSKDPAGRVQSMQEIAAGFRAIESQLMEGTAPRTALAEEKFTVAPASVPPLAAPLKVPKFSSFGLKLAATAFFAFCVILAAYLVNLNKQIEKRRVIAEADVRTVSTDLLMSPDLRSRRVASLGHRTRVQILDRAPTAEDRFVKAQWVSKNTLRTGYIAVEDLWNWRSTNSHVAWDLLLLGQPQKSAAPVEVKEYLAALGAYMERFPDAKEVNEAKQKQQQLSEWLVPAMQPATALLAPATAAPQQAPEVNAEREQQSQQLLATVPALWEEGSLETILEMTQKSLALNPANASAKSWRSRAQKALRKLNAQ